MKRIIAIIKALRYFRYFGSSFHESIKMALDILKAQEDLFQWSQKNRFQTIFRTYGEDGNFKENMFLYDIGGEKIRRIFP